MATGQVSGSISKTPVNRGQGGLIQSTRVRVMSEQPPLDEGIFRTSAQNGLRQTGANQPEEGRNHFQCITPDSSDDVNNVFTDLIDEMEDKVEYNKQGVDNVHKFATEIKEGTSFFFRNLLSIMPGNTVGKLAEIINQGEDYDEYKWIKECVNEVNGMFIAVGNARNENDRRENVRNENVNGGDRNPAAPHLNNGNWRGFSTPPPLIPVTTTTGSYRNAARRGINFASGNGICSQERYQVAINRQPGHQVEKNHQIRRNSSHAYQSLTPTAAVGNIRRGNATQELVSTNNNNIQRNINDAGIREDNIDNRQRPTVQGNTLRISQATGTAIEPARARPGTEEDVNNRINRRAEHLANERMYDLQRKKNIIISNLFEDMGESDRQMVEDILETLGCGHLLYDIVKTERIGSASGNRPKLLKVEMANENEVNLIMNRKNELVEDNTFYNVFLNNDLSKAERNRRHQNRLNRVGIMSESLNYSGERRPTTIQSHTPRTDARFPRGGGQGVKL